MAFADIESTRQREETIGHLVHVFDQFSASQNTLQHNVLYQFYGKMPELDHKVPHLHIASGTRHLYEEDLHAVRTELRKLSTEELAVLAANVDRIVDAGVVGPDNLRLEAV